MIRKKMFADSMNPEIKEPGIMKLNRINILFERDFSKESYMQCLLSGTPKRCLGKV